MVNLGMVYDIVLTTLYLYVSIWMEYTILVMMFEMSRFIHTLSTPDYRYTSGDDVLDQSPLGFQPPDQNLSVVAEFPMRSAKYLGHPNALFQLLQYLAYDLPLLSSKMGVYGPV